MDSGMPTEQREAWMILKRAVDNYSSLTGNEVACVTTYTPIHTLEDHYNHDSELFEQTTSIHGHGELLKLVKDGLDIARRNNNVHHAHGSFETSYASEHGNVFTNKSSKKSSSKGIAINANSHTTNGTHHDQSVARSLSSGYRSLRLDNVDTNGFNRYSQPKQWGIKESEEFSNKQSKSRRRSQRKSDSISNQENLELDENLLFGEEEPTKESSDDSDDSSYGNSYDRPPTLFNAPTRQTVGFGTQSTTKRNVAASLPVTINANWGGRSEVGFRDNEGPHPPLRYVKAQQPKQNTTGAFAAANISHTHQRSQDTPDPETMMASIQALARNVTNDSALIFGERPRPRLNTGETKLSVSRK